MTQPKIDIFPDSSRPEGGHAIVVVRSITEMPDPLRFKISALADDPDSDAEWSLGERAPLAARLTSDGLAMKIGPEIVDAPELQPGTPIAFCLSSANINAELSWPDLPVTIPGSLPAPLMEASDLRALKVETTRREAEAAARAKEQAAQRAAAAATAATGNGALNGRSHSVTHLAELSAKAAAPQTAGVGTANATGDTSVVAAASAQPQSAAPIAPTESTLATFSLGEVSTGSTAAVGPAPSLAKTADRAPLPATPHAQAIPAAHEIAAAPVHHDGARNDGASRNWLSIVLAIIAIPAILIALWPSLSTRITEQPVVKSTLAQLASSDWVTQILAVGNISPGGIDASRLSASDTLKRAEAAIFEAGGEPNLAERRFWLRKSISKLLADPQSRWAATQLGALKTAPSETNQQADYRSAKTLWELAGASGDTVATCFLAQLYELGLGVVASQEKAKGWYQRAAERGGCNVQHERSTPALTN